MIKYIMKIKRIPIFFLLFFTIFFNLNSEEDINSVFHTTAKNGLEIFIIENFETPLVYIELAFKAGGKYQNENTYGLFHFYEHMLFKGNSLYTDSAQVYDAMSQMGVTNSNGTTASDYVNYYFTIPAKSFEKGIEFWANAIINPLFDKSEIEKEKKVVISEILDEKTNPYTKGFNQVFKSFFNDSEYLSPGGTPENVQSFTIDDLLAMKEKYYIPNNCAIFIYGAVEKNNALNIIENYFSNWKPSYEILKQQENKEKQTSKEKPMFKDNFYLIKNPQTAAILSINFIGPDTINSIEDTYKSDFLLNLLKSQNNKFLRTLNSIKVKDNENAIKNFSYEYLTTTKNGYISFNFWLNPNNDNLSDTITKIINYVTLKEIPEISNNLDYFSEYQYKTTKESLIDQQTLDNEYFTNYISFLRFFWAVASTDVALHYYDYLNKITKEDISNFVKKYLLNKNFSVALFINDNLYSNEIIKLQNLGYKILED